MDTRIRNIIFPIEFNHLTGGMIFSVLSLAKNLSRDYNVYVLAHKEAEILEFTGNIKTLKINTPWSISIRQPYLTLKTCWEVRTVLKNFSKEDTVVFTNNVGSELIFSGFGFFNIDLPRVFVSRGGDYLGKTGWLIRRGFKKVRKFIAISNRQKMVLVKAGVKNSKIELIHNGIPANESVICSPIFNGKRSLTISVVGYISENKNQLLAVLSVHELIKRGYDVQLFIYGSAVADSDKIYKKKLMREIKTLDLQDKIIFKGFEYDHTQIYQNTDIVVSTSLSEGFGRTIAEAMAFGLPCIGLKESGGLLDIITNQHDGILINNTVEELVSACIELIENERMRNEISTNAVSTYKNKFTEKAMIAKYETFLEKLHIAEV